MFVVHIYWSQHTSLCFPGTDTRQGFPEWKLLNLLQGQTTGVIFLHTETSNTFFVHKTSIIAFLKEKIPHVQVKSSEYLILQKNLIWMKSDYGEKENAMRIPSHVSEGMSVQWVELCCPNWKHLLSHFATKHTSVSLNWIAIKIQLRSVNHCFISFF